MAIGTRKELAKLRDFSTLEQIGLPATVEHATADEFRKRGDDSMRERLYLVGLRNYAAALFAESRCKHVRFGFIREALRLQEQAMNACVIGSMSPAAPSTARESVAYFRGKESAGYGSDITNPYSTSPAKGDWRRGYQAGRREIEEAITHNQSDPYLYRDRYADRLAAEMKRPPSRAKSQYVIDRLRAIEQGKA